MTIQNPLFYLDFFTYLITTVCIIIFCYLRKELNETKSKLQDFENRKSDLRTREDALHLCVHEFASPLTLLQLQLKILKLHYFKDKTTLSVQSQSYKIFTCCENQLDRMCFLINDLREAIRMKHHQQIALNLEKVDLNNLIDEVIEQFAETAQSAGCKIIPSVHKNVIGYWDRFRIEQVFINLITNALRYGKNRPITICIEKEGDKAIIQISDQGIGISKSDQQRIFQRFQRATDQIHGLGLGLYIVSKNLQAHDATIEVISDIGKGATFKISLPLVTKSGLLDRMTI